ncbi:MAG: DUF2490 domain-containing protein [Bacteroidota bacterium]
MTKFLVTLLFSLLFFSVTGQERNFLLWNTNNLEVQLTDKTSVGATEKMHFAPKTGNINLKFGDISVDHEFSKYYEMGAVGRLLWIRRDSGWLLEKRAMIVGDLSITYKQFEFDFSNRLEYRMYKDISDHFRHRQMFSVEVPPFACSWFSIYIGEEGFYRFDGEKLHLARLHAGTKIVFNKQFEMKVYYVYQKSKKLSQWHTSDILGINLAVDL